MHNGNTPSSVPTSAPPPPAPPLPPGGLKNWNSKENSNTAPQNSGNSTAIPQVTHPVQPTSDNVMSQLTRTLAKRNQEAGDNRKQPEGQTVPAIPPKPIVKEQQNKRVIPAQPIVQKQQDTQPKPQQQPTTEINHSDKDKIITTQPTENSSIPNPILKINISVPKLSIAICLLFTSNVSAIGCVVATATLYKAAVVPIVPIAIFAVSMLVMFTSIIYIVSSIKNALKVDIESNVPLAPEENPGNVVDPSEPTPPPIISSESGGESQLPTPSPLISNHSSGGAPPPPPPPPPIANHLSGGEHPSPSNGPSKPGNNMGNSNREDFLSQIHKGVKLRKTDEGAKLLGQTKSDEEKPKTAKKLKSNNNFITDALKKRFAVMYTPENDEDDPSERSSHNEVSDPDSDWSDDESESNQSHKVRVSYDTSRQLSPQARPQPSTSDESPKPQVPKKPLHLQSNSQTSAATKENNAALVNASVDQTQVSFVEGRRKQFEGTR